MNYVLYTLFAYCKAYNYDCVLYSVQTHYTNYFLFPAILQGESEDKNEKICYDVQSCCHRKRFYA